MAKRKKKQKKERMALIDGEIMCFHMVTSAEFLDEQHNDDDEYWEVLDMRSAKSELRIRCKQIQKETKSDGFAMAFGSRENFRKKLSPEYKAHRKSKKPLGYWAIVKFCYDNFDCVDFPKIEGDDVMGIYHTDEDLKNGVETVLVSNDKDMRTLPGLLYDHTRPENGVVDITEAEALTWWGIQTLIGDSADGYKGCPGVGKVGAEDALGKFKTSKLKGRRLEKAIFNEVVNVFAINGYGKKDALLQARLARILRVGEYDYKKQKPILWTDKVAK